MTVSISEYLYSCKHNLLKLLVLILPIEHLIRHTIYTIFDNIGDIHKKHMSKTISVNFCITQYWVYEFYRM